MKKIFLVTILLSFLFVACSKSASDTAAAVTTTSSAITVIDNSKLEEIKTLLESIISEDKATYDDVENLDGKYKEFLGTYNNTTLLSKYFELKESFLNSKDSELVEYANSESFEINLFMMISKFAIDNGSFKDGSSVIMSNYDNFDYRLYIKENDVIVEKSLSYFSKENSSSLYRVTSNGFYVNAKNSFGAYVGNKLVFNVSIYTTSDLVSWIFL